MNENGEGKTEKKSKGLLAVHVREDRVAYINDLVASGEIKNKSAFVKDLIDNYRGRGAEAIKAQLAELDREYEARSTALKQDLEAISTKKKEAVAKIEEDNADVIERLKKGLNGRSRYTALGWLEGPDQLRDLETLGMNANQFYDKYAEQE